MSCQNSETGASRLVWSKKRNRFKTGEKSNSLNFLLFFATIKASRIISPCQNSRPLAWSQEHSIQKMQSMFTSPPPTLYLATTKVFCDIMSGQGSETGATRLCKVKEMERTREKERKRVNTQNFPALCNNQGFWCHHIEIQGLAPRGMSVYSMYTCLHGN